MNILFETSNYHPYKGGAESLIEDLANEFTKKGHSVTIVTPKKSAASPALEKRNNAEIIRLQYPRTTISSITDFFIIISQSCTMLFNLYRVIKKKKIDTVCIGLIGIGSFFILLLRYSVRFKITIYLHGDEIKECIKTSKVINWTLKRLFKVCDSIISVSEDLKEEAIEFMPSIKKKAYVISNGINLEKINTKSAYNYQRDYILYAGRLHPIKGVDVLIKAFSFIHDEVSDLDLLIAGTGPQEDQLKDMADKYDQQRRVKFLGAQERDEIFSLIKGCKFFVLPSYSEACPLVILEAIAAGKMPVVSKIDNMHSVVEDGVTGVFFNPGDAKKLSSLIQRYYINSEELSNIESNIKRIDLRKYDIEKISQEHLKVYKQYL